jgi:hypothetical protein
MSLRERLTVQREEALSLAYTNGRIMPRLARPLLSLTFLALASAAFAAGSSAPFGYTPDPALRTAGKEELEGRVRRACASTQAQLQNVATSKVERPCGCYASRVMAALDESEIQAYRATGVFNDSARAKALTALDSCKLKRPV